MHYGQTVQQGVPHPSCDESRDCSKELSVQYSNLTPSGHDGTELGPYIDVDGVPLDILCQGMDSPLDHDLMSDPSNHTQSYNIEYAVHPI